jgi:hypothetical protein
MASTASLSVSCPGCGQRFDIPVACYVNPPEDGTVLEPNTIAVTLSPDTRALRDHISTEHAGD